MIGSCIIIVVVVGGPLVVVANYHYFIITEPQMLLLPSHAPLLRHDLNPVASADCHNFQMFRAIIKLFFQRQPGEAAGSRRRRQRFCSNVSLALQIKGNILQAALPVLIS